MGSKRVRDIVAKNIIPLIILGLYLGVSLCRLQDIPPPWQDEINHLNTALHFAKEGRIWNDFYAPKFENVCFAGTPLQWILLGIYVKIFGINYFGARLLYLSYSLITILGSYLLAYKLFNKKIALYSMAILAGTHLFFDISRQILPEVPAAMFCIIAILFFIIAKEKKTGAIFFLSGLMSACSFLCHPTGLGASVVITLLFFYNRLPLKYLFIYLGGIFVATMPYLVFVLANFKQYLYQTSFIMSHGYSHRSVFLNIVDEIPVRYLKLFYYKDSAQEILVHLKWIIKNLNLKIYFCEIMPNVIFLSSLGYLIFRKSKDESQKQLLLITTVYVFLLALHPNKFVIYLYILVPFFSICLAILVTSLIKRKRSVAILLMVVFFVVNLAHIYRELSSKKIHSYSRFVNEKVMSHIPKGSRVLAPHYFWLGMHKDYDFVSVSQVIYELDKISLEKGIKFTDLPPDEQENLITAVLAKYNVEYVLLTWHNWFGITEGMSTEGSFDFKRYFFSKAYKKADFLREKYYSNLPAANSYKDELYYPPTGMSFNNVSSEYQESLKIYKMRVKAKGASKRDTPYSE